MRTGGIRLVTISSLLLVCFQFGCKIGSRARLEYDVRDYRSSTIDAINSDLDRAASAGWAFDAAYVFSADKPPVIILRRSQNHSHRTVSKCMIRDYRGFIEPQLFSQVSRDLTALGADGWRVVEITGSTGNDRLPYVILCR